MNTPSIGFTASASNFNKKARLEKKKKHLLHVISKMLPILPRNLDIAQLLHNHLLHRMRQNITSRVVISRKAIHSCLECPYVFIWYMVYVPNHLNRDKRFLENFLLLVAANDLIKCTTKQSHPVDFCLPVVFPSKEIQVAHL